ncbi:hypothetical protein THAOC_35435 [Thalassiosira oceanica]|uniref:Uncharacterized protein n=1 Tax=Thalassiosira oceanica TaxID=159749 RepID=K0RA85_THAOC|nr:hypothetical protein THAOC_35435 [Thalassiosira oceanica]|eukprot:EJK45926.1 hypothetical protein THAOC_35435 [Thalassiosira oceanica]
MPRKKTKMTELLPADTDPRVARGAEALVLGTEQTSFVARCAPKGVQSIHKDGEAEARQLKTNPFPTQKLSNKEAPTSAGISGLCWRSFSGDRSAADNSICGPTALLLARSLNWSSQAVCSCLVAHLYHLQQTSTAYARSSAGPQIHYLDAPQTQPSSMCLQRQQAGGGSLKLGAYQTVSPQLLVPVDS